MGFEKFRPYLIGERDGQPKDAAWAEKITGIAADRIVALAREMAANRTMISIGWSLQRAHHGEQPFWALVTLAAMLGQIGLPGGGFGCGYGPSNTDGQRRVRSIPARPLPQGANPVREFIPVARFADMLLHPGERFAYNGAEHTYPDIRLVYWAGGNPFHHHQDLNRLRLAWRKPETVIFHEQFWTPAAKMADIVLPATTTPGARRHRLCRARALSDRDEEGARAGGRSARRLRHLPGARPAHGRGRESTPRAARSMNGSLISTRRRA